LIFQQAFKYADGGIERRDACAGAFAVLAAILLPLFEEA